MATDCTGNPHNCQLLIAVTSLHRDRCGESGITDPNAVVNAMAVGLVEEIWRNGPVEGMHSGRRGPSDAAMFAESTDLQVQAVHALRSPSREQGLLTFEQHLLDRNRPWAGTGGRNLRDLGYGYLGDYARHIKSRTNTMLNLNAHSCVDDPLEVYLVNRALTMGHDHKGMPAWAIIVDRIGTLLESPHHPAWHDDLRGEEARTHMPPDIVSVEALKATLLDQPSDLSDDVLSWLSDYFLYSAAPPYSRFKWDTPGTTRPCKQVR
ncbi:hypothetical protein ACWEK5_41155 [Rhodococcus koreensis]